MTTGVTPEVLLANRGFFRLLALEYCKSDVGLAS